MEYRRRGRVTPPGRVTVVIQDEEANTLAKGVVVNLSTKGARIWSTAPLPTDATLRFNLEFALPPGEYELKGRVVWAEDGGASSKGACHVGVEWQHPTRSHVRRWSETWAGADEDRL